MAIIKTYTQLITDGRPFIEFNEWILTLTLTEQHQYETASSTKIPLRQQHVIDGNVIESVDKNGKVTVSFASTEILKSIDDAHNPILSAFWNRYLLENGVRASPAALTYTGNDTAPVVEVAPTV